MHVGAASQDAAALPAMIDQLRARGYRFQTVRDFIAPTSRYFPETGHTVSGNFLRYWNGFGGLASFGFPISDVFTRDGVQMQYFCLLYTSPSPRDRTRSRMPSSA